MNIKELRVENRLSQTELCKILNCSQSLYSMYENGIRNVPLETVVKLSFLYKTSIDYIVGITDVSAPKKRASIDKRYIYYWEFLGVEESSDEG
ncbi:helix-turn-helix transcriptional regulator [Enterococcus sp.]|uniref:helix-turn-helix domain-containing protein n=1 Tax=Enterococcus sp. TaxID=35783 RepID=UPI00290C972F|nr:helix-turn-helix transcriptional regulator [Enterococcus sp.]MDU5337107.1 helix-turn-helix transcriptional regulator [Enterococcus sp.]